MIVCYKLRQKVLQSVAAFRCYKLRQNFLHFAAAHFSQSVAILLESEVVVTKWGKNCYKVWQLLQSGAKIGTKCGNFVTK